ncbi:hypothetical protein GPECTOR_39g449 [Gonium pectorale]|uniref:Peptidase S8/S53 domain-containing protein n=1 Tax=Gonium pectorale TaxID=33097 RepID=A0A150GBL5_GONPE|nr:hypothetical protein GPECTOR_39g449 [Gonium pectorale]|eukprot:KXZ46955.1 hypothetical protein GPECTOR_39g449 [Gonium pectorale]
MDRGAATASGGEKRANARKGGWYAPSAGGGGGGSGDDGIFAAAATTGEVRTGPPSYRVDAGSAQSVSADRQEWLWEAVGHAALERLAAAEAVAVSAVAVAAAEEEGEDEEGFVGAGNMAQMAPQVEPTSSHHPDPASVDVREHPGASSARLRSVGPKRDPLDRALWHLDRIDQRGLPLDGAYAFGSDRTLGTGAGVTLYSLDSGVFAEHNEFQPWPDDEDGGGGGQQHVEAAARARPRGRVQYGYDFVDDDDVAEDCDGHGTHVASTAVGRSVGVARGSRLVAVRVLDCGGSGTIANTVAGLEWVARNAKAPAVALMSLGVPAGNWSTVLAEGVRKLIRQYGIPVVVASGNAALDSCTVVPANVPEALTVAASNLENKFGPDPRVGRELIYQWANTGACVDIFAPGVEVFGACGGASRCPQVTRGSYTWASGTSMAVPAVAAVAALYLEMHPAARPDQVSEALLAAATRGALRDGRMLPNTPNRLLYSRFPEMLPSDVPAGDERLAAVSAAGGPDAQLGGEQQADGASAAAAGAGAAATVGALEPLREPVNATVVGGGSAVPAQRDR